MSAEAIFGNIFAANPIVVKRVMSLRCQPQQHSGKDDQDGFSSWWSNRTAKSIIKVLAKLKLLEDFDVAVNLKSTSKCIALSRLIESSLVGDEHCVSGSGLTAVCKLWRWQNLVTYFELQSVKTCLFPISSDHLENVCINPYHYEKIQLPDPYVYVPMSNHSNSASIDGDHRVKLEPSGESAHCPDLNINSQLTNLDNQHVPMSDEGNPPSYSTLMLNKHDSHHPPLYDLKGLAAVSYVKPPFWCSVSYYELNQRVGAIFHASQNSLTVDGFTDPSCSDRFCLGSLSNIARNPESESCRKRIGRGVRLYYISGEVYAECLSENPIFAQSISSNKKEGWHPATVCKIPPGYNLKIFNNQQFAEMLANTVPQGFDAVYQLTALCTIRMSFVKGWGSDYKRQTITSTPCWIEIHLNGPLQWLDRVIACLQPPGTLSTN